MQPIYHNNNYIPDYKEKAEIFNNFFAKQCTIVNNTSKLPTDSLKRTNNFLSSISFTKDDIAKIIKKLLQLKLTFIMASVFICRKFVVNQS